MRTSAVPLAQAVFLIAVALLAASGANAQVQITLDPATRYQTITGWEATAQAGQTEVAGFDKYKDEVFDRAVDELGITRLRLEFKSNLENSTDYFTLYQTGQIDQATYQANRYISINDNADPNSANLAGFQFAELDNTIDKVVLPMRQRLIARGEKLYVNLCQVDFGTSTFEHATNAPEYAEMISVIFAHMQSKYGFVPDGVEICLEPENAPAWNNHGDRFANAIVATGDRLKAEGYTPDFIAPSVTQMTHAVSYVNNMIATNPRVTDYLKELSYHRYRDSAATVDANLPALVTLANQYGLNLAMLEHMGETYVELHADLTIGNNSSWQQFALAYGWANLAAGGDGSMYYAINNSDPNNPVVTLGTTAKFFTQYFKYIRPGAVRIKATTSDTNFSPAAFINKDGGYAVVIKAAAAGSFWLSGLPAGTYEIIYTTSTQFAVQAGTVALANGQTLGTSIPAAGALTVHAKAGPAPVSTCYIFYNNSKFDGFDPAANAADDNAIALDKVPLMPGGTATFANYTSYSKGINGIMIDIPNMPGTPTASDFTLRKGNSGTPSSWTNVTVKSNYISVRRGAGLNGADRLTLTLPDGVINNTWLQVTAKASANTGVASDEVFYYGNASGESGNSPSSARVDSSDVQAARNDPHKSFANPASITDQCDFDRNGKVDTADEVIARGHTTTVLSELKLISAP